MKIVIIISIPLFLIIIRYVYFYFKFKRDSKYPCFVVIRHDYSISKPMYYKDAKEYSDRIFGTIKVDRKEFKRLKKINYESTKRKH
jgi:hypothetical protein